MLRREIIRHDALVATMVEVPQYDSRQKSIYL